MAIKRDSTLFTVFLGALSALPPLSIDMGLPAIPDIEHHFPDAAGRGALTLSLFLAGFALSPLFCGPLADRFGRRLTLLVGLMVFTIGAAASGFAPSFNSLLLFRLLQGVAAGACVILPLAIVRDLFHGAAAMALLSQVSAVLGIAPMAAPILGSFVLGVSDWRMIYLTQAGLGVVLLAMTLTSFVESLPADKRRSLNPRHLLATYRTVLSDRIFLGYTLVYAFGFAAMFSYISSSAAVIMTQLHLSSPVFALVFAITSCGVMFGSLASGALAKRGVSSRTIMTYGMTGLLAATTLLFALTSAGLISIYVISPLVAAIIFCFGLIGPSSNHEAIHKLGHVAGSASGVMRCIQMFLGSLASALVAALEPTGNPALNMVCLMLGAALLGGGAYVLTIRHEGRLTAAADPQGEPDRAGI